MNRANRSKIYRIMSKAFSGNAMRDTRRKLKRNRRGAVIIVAVLAIAGILSFELNIPSAQYSELMGSVLMASAVLATVIGVARDQLIRAKWRAYLASH